MNKLVGKVTCSEKDEIRSLVEYGNELHEKSKSLTTDNAEFFEALTNELEEVTGKIQQWWKAIEMKYKWESMPNCSWHIDLDTNEIYLTDNQT